MKSRLLLEYAKNLIGWRCRRKIIVFSVDDYGNVRLASKQARMNLDKAGHRAQVRFDAYDAMETREDLEALYEVLSSVKDSTGRAAIFTPFAVSCNIDFELMRSEGYRRYVYEFLPRTFEKLSAEDSAAYDGAWTLWKEGIARGIMKPEFHGREHFNLKIFLERLAAREDSVMESLKNRSLTSISPSKNGHVSWTSAFGFWDEVEDTRDFTTILQSGLDAFVHAFGYRARIFTPPSQQFPVTLEGELPRFGVQVLDKPFYQLRHLGKGRYGREFSFTGYQRRKGIAYMVRNASFEPSSGNIDWVGRTLVEIEAAFRLKRPAIISSHRVNFSGHIDPKIRRHGLSELKKLLKAIRQKWPESEFMSAGEMGDLMYRST